MPFLKEKIARAKLLRNLQARKSKEGVKRRSSEEWSLQSEKSTSPNSPIKSQKKTETGSRKSSESEDGKATKNIAQNFGRAICTFAASSISIPYLLPILEEEKLSFCSFKQSIMATKKSINCLCDFREALMIHQTDSLEQQALKRAFRLIGEIFIKYFSVNWIYAGKMKYRKAYLKYRFKMLRRIRNPELFTYLR